MNPTTTVDITERANELRMHLHVFPNVLVAWADGSQDKNERALIERIARIDSILQSSTAARTLRPKTHKVPSILRQFQDC